MLRRFEFRDRTFVLTTLVMLCSASVGSALAVQKHGYQQRCRRKRNGKSPDRLISKWRPGALSSEPGGHHKSQTHYCRFYYDRRADQGECSALRDREVNLGFPRRNKSPQDKITCEHQRQQAQHLGRQRPSGQQQSGKDTHEGEAQG